MTHSQPSIAATIADIGPRLTALRARKQATLTESAELTTISKVNGTTLIPLSRRPGPQRAYKIALAVDRTEPKTRVHDGFTWLYVPSGQLRLVLGEHDLVLEPGEIAQFDTRWPHWFGSAGQGAVEILSLFGEHADRPRVRARSA